MRDLNAALKNAFRVELALQFHDRADSKRVVGHDQEALGAHVLNQAR
jgi:hypothetical protein